MDMPTRPKAKIKYKQIKWIQLSQVDVCYGNPARMAEW